MATFKLGPAAQPDNNVITASRVVGCAPDRSNLGGSGALAQIVPPNTKAMWGGTASATRNDLRNTSLRLASHPPWLGWRVSLKLLYITGTAELGSVLAKPPDVWRHIRPGPSELFEEAYL